VLKAFSRPPAAGEDLFASATPSPADATRDAIEARAKGIPLARWGTPRDIANAVVFLASPGAAWITGAILVVDGGEWLARSAT
jgi:NAD(P)-dependent dehydrogenase (short-subunit alcohol dehydrogenase family)